MEGPMHCVFRQMPSDRSIGGIITLVAFITRDLFASRLANDKDPMRVKYKGSGL